MHDKVEVLFDSKSHVDFKIKWKTKYLKSTKYQMLPLMILRMPNPFNLF